MSHPRTPSRVSPARRSAYDALAQIYSRDAFAQEVIAKRIDGSDMPDEERAFATRLVLGVVSCRGSLDELLDRFLRSPKDVKPDVRLALLIPLYEAFYLGKSPHAVVDQGVELVKCVASRAAGLANSVLRKAVKAVCEFPFGDPAVNVDALSLAQGFPSWLTERLVSELGFDGAREFEEASNEPAPVYVFESQLKANSGIREALENAGGFDQIDSVCGVPLQGCLLAKDRKALANAEVIASIERGEALVSDASAQAVAALCSIVASSSQEAKATDASELIQPATKDAIADFGVLELCAGRATKTIMLQSGIFERLGRQAKRYVTLDNAAFKCELLRKRAELYGAHVSDAACCDFAEGKRIIDGGEFGLVFLDAPCTGLGTLRRHPEIRWRITPDAIDEAANLDARLIANAALNVRDAGYLVYATCTVTPEENECVIERFLATPEGSHFRRLDVFGKPCFSPKLTPGSPDAHFCTILQRHFEHSKPCGFRGEDALHPSIQSYVSKNSKRVEKSSRR